MSTDPMTPAASPAEARPEARQEDAIYQGDRLVARALDARVNTDAREIYFGEIYNSDELLLPEDCEFGRYRIMVTRVEFAAREERGAAHKGRVLRGVVADILGYREQ